MAEELFAKLVALQALEGHCQLSGRVDVLLTT